MTQTCSTLLIAIIQINKVYEYGMVWYGNCLFDIYKRHSEKNVSNTTILNTRVYNVCRLHIWYGNSLFDTTYKYTHLNILHK